MARFCKLLNTENLFGQRKQKGRETGGVGFWSRRSFDSAFLPGGKRCVPAALLEAARGPPGVQEIQKTVGLNPQCSKGTTWRNTPERICSQRCS